MKNLAHAVTPLHLLTNHDRSSLRWAYRGDDRAGAIRFAKNLADGCADPDPSDESDQEPTSDINALADILSRFFSARSVALLTSAVMMEFNQRDGSGQLGTMLVAALLDAETTP